MLVNESLRQFWEHWSPPNHLHGVEKRSEPRPRKNAPCRKGQYPDRAIGWAGNLIWKTRSKLNRYVNLDIHGGTAFSLASLVVMKTHVFDHAEYLLGTNGSSLK